MPTLKHINEQVGTSFRRTTELIEALKPPPEPELVELSVSACECGSPPLPDFPMHEVAGPEGFTVTYEDGAIIVDGPYDSKKYYRLTILSDQGNPIQDVHPSWGGWPFEWSARTLPDNPRPPAPPFKWQLQEENYISRRWRNRRQYPSDYVSTMYEGEIE